MGIIHLPEPVKNDLLFIFRYTNSGIFNIKPDQIFFPEIKSHLNISFSRKFQRILDQVYDNLLQS